MASLTNGASLSNGTSLANGTSHTNGTSHANGTSHTNGTSHSNSLSKSGVSPLKAYANAISSAADAITEYCISSDLPHPSFRPDAPKITIPLTAPLAIQDARQTLIDSATKSQQIITEPADYLPRLAVHYQTLSCLRWLSHFRILSFIPLHDSITYSELAKTANVPEHQLRSVIRMALTSNFLSQPELQSVAHNSVSRLFVTDPGFADWLDFMTQYSMPAAASFAEATDKWGTTVEKDQTAFNVAAQTKAPFFEYFAKTSELSNQFASYMRSVQASSGTSLQHLLTGYDWESLDDEAVVVDVGGSTCSSTIALASAFPTLHFVVQDLPDTIAASASILTLQPPSIRSRISTQPHNFFTPQPIRTASVYLLRMILHDWPFNDALTILKNLLPTLKPVGNPPSHRSRLLVMDTVLPPPGSTSVVEEALLRVRDLTMTQTFNSRERELGEFEDLFAQAADEEGRLVLKGLRKPPGSMLSVMEVAYEAYGSGGEGGRGANGHSTA